MLSGVRAKAGGPFRCEIRQRGAATAQADTKGAPTLFCLVQRFVIGRSPGKLCRRSLAEGRPTLLTVSDGTPCGRARGADGGALHFVRGVVLCRIGRSENAAGALSFQDGVRFLDMLQILRPRQKRANPCVGMLAVTNPVGLCHGVPQQQKSVLANETALLRIRTAILGIFHAHDVHGFSKIKVAPTVRQARAKFTTHRSRRFPMSTLV